MSNPLHIHLIATRLIALHGRAARSFAANKADAMLAAGKLYERRTWRRVQEEVERALARDLLGDFPGLVAGLYADHAEPLSRLTPFRDGACGEPFAADALSSDTLSSDPQTPETLALSTKWMSS